MEEIRKQDEGSFGSKAAAASVLQSKGLSDTHEVIEVDDGFIGVPKNKERPKQKLTKCRVHRSNCDPDNKDMPISITPNRLSNRKTFWPGEEVMLTDSHLSILKTSVEEVRIPIPPESGIYASKDPVAVAKNQYPSMTVEVSQMDNTITMVSRTPNYIIEVVE